MFKLDYTVTIGKNKFNGVTGVEIKRSITSLTGTAKITIPTTAVLKQTDGSRLNVLTAQQIKRGDPVEIELGYNNKLNKEFSGYVTRVNLTRPLEVECEDAVFLLRDKKIKKSYKKSDAVTLQTVLEDIVTGTKITVKTGDLSVNIEKLLLTAKNGDEVPCEEALNYVLERYGLVGYFDTEQNLFVGLRYGKRLNTVKYRLGWNTINDDELKYHKAEDMKVKIKAVYFNTLGKKVTLEVGDSDGSLRTIFLTGVKATDEIDKLAKNELAKYKFDGFAGKVTTFLQPFAEPGSIAALSDPKYSQRDGDYYIEGVEVKFGDKGVRRTIELGAKV